MTVATSGGQASVTHLGALDASAVQDLQDTECAGRQTILTGAADAIPFPGTVQLNSSSADLTTLATPVSGPQPVGDDGKTIFIYDNTGKAHTVITATNKIINSKKTATFNATIGSNITLQAQGGIWVPVGTPSGVTLS
jgi:hypothetical protein